MSNKLHNRIKNISDLIAKDIVSEDEIQNYIRSDNKILYLYYSDEVSAYNKIKDVDPENIKGFLTASIYQNIDELAVEREYAEDFKNSKYYSESVFPITNLVKMSVDKKYQENDIGTKLYSKSVIDAYSENRCPLISRMWKKSNQKNGHINRAERFGGDIISENEDFLDYKECRICNEMVCNCSNVVIVFDI